MMVEKRYKGERREEGGGREEDEVEMGSYFCV